MDYRTEERKGYWKYEQYYNTVFERYVTERCEIGVSIWIQASLLYADYCAWATEKSIPIIWTQAEFGRRLSRAGYAPQAGRSYRKRIGISLKHLIPLQ